MLEYKTVFVSLPKLTLNRSPGTKSNLSMTAEFFRIFFATLRLAARSIKTALADLSFFKISAE